MYLPITIFLLVLLTESILFLGFSYITELVREEKANDLFINPFRLMTPLPK